MGRTRKLTMLMVIGILPSLLLTGCSNEKAVQDINSLNLGDKTITAGNHFRLSPVKDETITISGKMVSANDFGFHCTLLSKETDIEYKGAVTFQGSYSTGVTATETQSVGEFTKWPPGITRKDITIRFVLLPTINTYSGNGFLYFYLINKQNQCISNIVKWKAKFV